jgi:hypothetical protein
MGEQESRHWHHVRCRSHAVVPLLHPQQQQRLHTNPQEVDRLSQVLSPLLSPARGSKDGDGWCYYLTNFGAAAPKCEADCSNQWWPSAPPTLAPRTPAEPASAILPAPFNETVDTTATLKLIMCSPAILAKFYYMQDRRLCLQKRIYEMLIN